MYTLENELGTELLSQLTNEDQNEVCQDWQFQLFNLQSIS